MYSFGKVVHCVPLVICNYLDIVNHMVKGMTSTILNFGRKCPELFKKHCRCLLIPIPKLHYLTMSRSFMSLLVGWWCSQTKPNTGSYLGYALTYTNHGQTVPRTQFGMHKLKPNYIKGMDWLWFHRPNYTLGSGGPRIFRRGCKLHGERVRTPSMPMFHKILCRNERIGTLRVGLMRAGCATPPRSATAGCSLTAGE